MAKYFFDRVSRERSEYDYHGRMFPSPESARQLAELIAIDLAIESDGRWCGWNVSVCNAYGEKFFSIPVQPELVCA